MSEEVYRYLQKKYHTISHQPGVYIMRDRIGGVIYVGKAKDLKKRLGSYFTPSRRQKAIHKVRALIDSIYDFDVQEVRNEQEALLLETKLIKQYRPRYNVMMRDDKRFYLVRVQLKEQYPRFTLTRFKKDDGAKYFGPFVHSDAIKATIEWVNRENGLKTCRPASPSEDDYKHCHADVIRNCAAPCVGKISEEDYRERVMIVCDMLGGKGKREQLSKLEQEMLGAAEKLQFEKAAKLRNIYQNLEKALNPSRQFARRINIESTLNPEEDLKELAYYLGLPCPPRVMECFDISNVSSNHIVASMVRFIDGRPDNQSYRRYRIKTVQGQDDFASMAEVVRRRYQHILKYNAEQVPELQETQEDAVSALRRLGVEGKLPLLLPDLVIVDGGKGQLSSAYRELKVMGLSGLAICGLAKQHEEIFFPGESEPICIPHDKGALKLIQRIRDEAHRFANNYNELLMRKRVKESALDDCPGMNKARKIELFKKYGTVRQMKQATADELKKIKGIGEKTAANIHEWLQQR